MTVVRCAACGLVFVNPRPRFADIEAHYNSGESSRVDYYRDAEAADRRTFAEIVGLAAGLAPRAGRWLDVGPCTGTLLGMARDAGFAVRGIEINAAAAGFCREERQLDVQAGVLAGDTFPPASFDIVTMGDVIEHVQDPVATLRNAASVLAPGGHVIISTPNIGSAAARWLQLKPLEHLYYFSAETMSATLARAGFADVRVRSYDRYRNYTGMSHSTTCGTLFQRLAPLFTLAHRLAGDVVVRLPLSENLLAIARRP
jgi:2-polyprenyl-3-methyl-5-hydroxy-6-metoxy-1,4-benzoquinol methylase